MLGGKKLGEKIATSLEAQSADWMKSAMFCKDTGHENAILNEAVAITLKILAGIIREETSK